MASAHRGVVANVAGVGAGSEVHGHGLGLPCWTPPVLHTAFWSGTETAAPELRLRVAKFGATLEDRLRLRVEATGSRGSPSERPPAQRASSSRRSRLLRPLVMSRRLQSLGWALIDWIETFCVHGPGDVEGQPVEAR